MNLSRYIKYVRQHIPGYRRAIPRKWTESQSGKYYRCRICGFTCNTDRDRLGDGTGVYVTDAILPAHLTAFDGNISSHTLSISTIKDLHLIEMDSNGDPKIFKRNFTTTVTSGCPFCGSQNWK